MKNSNILNIFVIPSIYPWEKAKNAGIFIFEQSKALKMHGHKVVVLDATGVNYLKWNDESCKKIIYKKTEAGKQYTLHVRALMISKLPRLAIFTTKSVLNQLYIKAVKENGKPDVIIAHFSLPAGFAALSLAKEEKIPIVIIEHYSHFLKNHLHPYIKTALCKAIFEASAFICVSEELKTAIERHTNAKNKILVIPNLIDSRFRFYQKNYNNKFIFFSAGNLTNNKRFDLLIEAFCKAFTIKDNVILRIAGDGQKKEKLKKIIKKYLRGKQIELLGLCSREEMLEEYKKCNCFVLLSRKETFGIVYREAMAVGRPIIATKNGGIEENWDSNNGIIVQYDDIDTIANALKNITSSKEFSIKNISEKCISLYSENVVISKLEKVLFDVVYSKSV